MTSEELLKEAQNYQDKIVKDRRYLHMHPGTGFDISEAVEYVKQELSEMDVSRNNAAEQEFVQL